MAEDTRGIPPEITADQVFGVPRIEDCYQCDNCGRQFLTLVKLADHLMDCESAPEEG